MVMVMVLIRAAGTLARLIQKHVTVSQEGSPRCGHGMSLPVGPHASPLRVQISKYKVPNQSHNCGSNIISQKIPVFDSYFGPLL